MSIIVNKIQAYLSALLTVLVLLAAGYGWYKSQRLEHVSEERNVAEADASSHKEYTKQHKRIAAEEKAVEEKVHAAVEANPEWSTVALPDDIADILRDPAQSTE